MTDNCQILDTTAADVARATLGAQSAYNGFQQQGYLPPEGTLYPILGFDSSASAIGVMGDIVIEPLTMSCLSEDQITGVIAHEVAHHNDPMSVVNLVNIGDVQSLIMLAAVAALGFRAVKVAVFKLAGHKRPAHIKDKPVLALCMLGHTGFGMHAADIRHQSERAADAYAVQLMQDPEPLASALERINNIDYGRDIGLTLQDLTNTALLSAVAEDTTSKFWVYGAVGMHFIYPSDEDRVAAIRATPLTGQRPEPNLIYVQLEREQLGSTPK